MLSGFYEILVLLVAIFLVFLVPRFSKNYKNQITLKQLHREKKVELTWKSRLFIVGSLIWLASFAIYIRPWENSLTHYIVVGTGPVILFWSVCWIKAGVK